MFVDQLAPHRHETTGPPPASPIVPIGPGPSVVTSEAEPPEPEGIGNEVDELVDALATKFEEIAVINRLSDSLQLGIEPRQLCSGLLTQLHDCIRADRLALVLCDGDRREEVVSPLGDLELDLVGPTGELIVGCEAQRVCNPHINNAFEFDGEAYRLAVMPICRQRERLGWLYGVRRTGMNGTAEEFGTVEGDLMKSTMLLLGVHLLNHRHYTAMRQMFEGITRSLVSSLDAKDAYTCGHSNRVSELSVELARRAGYDDETVDRIRLAGLLHDIGKIGVDDSVLKKPGRLTDDEFEQIKQHPVIGYEILKGIDALQDILPAVRHHHESMDGSGYPDGLSHDAIPRDAQILAVADAFDAMTSDRPYRRGMSLEKVTRIFRDGRGSQWAADLVDILLGCPDVMMAYALKTEPADPV